MSDVETVNTEESEGSWLGFLIALGITLCLIIGLWSFACGASDATTNTNTPECYSPYPFGVVETPYYPNKILCIGSSRWAKFLQVTPTYKLGAWLNMPEWKREPAQ